MSTLSFHETKNVTCGEGGALVINDNRFLERAEILREKGTDRSKFLKGQVDKYTWVDVGSSWVISDILASMLVAQLERFDSIQRRRVDIWNAYYSALEGWATDRGIGMAPRDLPHTAHMFYLIMENANQRNSLIQWLREKNIVSVFHYQPLHKSAVGLRFSPRGQSFHTTDNAGERLLRLPVFPALEGHAQDKVIRTVKSFQYPR